MNVKETKLTPPECKSLAYFFVHEMQNNSHCAMAWKAREQMETIIYAVIAGNAQIDANQFHRGLNGLIFSVELDEYPDAVQADIKRIRKRIWKHLQDTRQEYYE